jgi:hypothetical protein
VPAFLATVRDLHPDAFVSMSEARSVQHGWLPSQEKPINHL